MTSGTDRRSVLTGLGALGVMGCSQQAAAPVAGPARAALDLSALEVRHGAQRETVIADATRMALEALGHG